MNQNAIGHCPNCKVQVAVDPSMLIKASRLECYWCGVVQDVAAYELRQPGLSPEAKQFWSLVGAVAFVIGLAKFVDYVAQRA
jgi:hypothetical protein